jgi:ATP-dependent Clp protease protease subunit
MRENRLRQLIGQNAATGAGIQCRKAEAGGGTEVLIYDVIDPWFGVSAAAFAKSIASIGNGDLTVRINSPGGDVFEGRAIASLLRAHGGKVTAIVDGLAASAASTIAVAAGTLVMSKGSFLMVHNAWAITMDNAAGLRSMADLLDKVDGQLADDYATKAGVTAAVARAWMAAETWFTADEAVTAGLANGQLDTEGKLLAFNLAAFDHVPDTVTTTLAALQAPQPNEATLRAAAERRMRLLDLFDLATA